MGTIRSLLWIGRGEDFAGELAADAPRLDVVWEQNLEARARHPDQLLHPRDARACKRGLCD